MSASNSKYFTLLVKYESCDSWSIAFGDYDKECVMQEKEDSYSDCYKTKIIKTDDTQSAIETEVARLNTIK